MSCSVHCHGVLNKAQVNLVFLPPERIQLNFDLDSNFFNRKDIRFLFNFWQCFRYTHFFFINRLRNLAASSYPLSPSAFKRFIDTLFQARHFFFLYLFLCYPDLNVYDGWPRIKMLYITIESFLRSSKSVCMNSAYLFRIFFVLFTDIRP